MDRFFVIPESWKDLRPGVFQKDLGDWKRNNRREDIRKSHRSRDPNQKPSKKPVWMFLFVLLFGSIFFSCYAVPGSIIESGANQTDIMYRDGLLGPYYVRTIDDTGWISYSIQYPWYYFKEFANSMNLVSIGVNDGMKQGKTAYYTADVGQSSVPLKLYLQNSFKAYIKEVNLWFYEGQVTSSSDSYQNHPSYFHVTKEGMWAEDETFMVSCNFPLPSTAGGYSYTIDEVETTYGILGYAGDSEQVGRGWLIVNLLNPQATTGTLKVIIYDNLVGRDCHINLYKDGSLYKSNIFCDNGEHTFTGLPFANYRVQVVESSYEPYFYDSNPLSAMVDESQGVVKLSSSSDSVTYLVFGDNLDTTGNGASANDGEDTSGSEVEDPQVNLGDEEEDESDSSLWAILGALIWIIPLAIIGVPVFLLVALAVLLIAWRK